MSTTCSLAVNQYLDSSSWWRTPVNVNPRYLKDQVFINIPEMYLSSILFVNLVLTKTRIFYRQKIFMRLIIDIEPLLV